MFVYISGNAEARFFIFFLSAINKYSILFLYLYRWNTIKRIKRSSKNIQRLFFNRINRITLTMVKWTNEITCLLL